MFECCFFLILFFMCRHLMYQDSSLTCLVRSLLWTTRILSYSCAHRCSQNTEILKKCAVSHLSIFIIPDQGAPVNSYWTQQKGYLDKAKPNAWTDAPECLGSRHFLQLRFLCAELRISSSMTKAPVYSFAAARPRIVSRRGFSLPNSKVFPVPQLLLGFSSEKRKNGTAANVSICSGPVTMSRTKDDAGFFRRFRFWGSGG